ncbi:MULTISPECIES: hypothetical protein [Stenotrophomonas]|nr:MULTISPECIES: hypothetical protein [Stenotrophomonas]MBH1587527.1 hypothetical protein [Stenotrophomonas maltophilia]MCU1005347.1 hypothetical protein [Stenotrophomonas maltophilia]MCU1158131.1 hypothetical protein [Stenotrophomonas maltophilia]
MLAAELGVNIDTSAARGEGIADASTLLIDRQATAAAANRIVEIKFK